MAKTVCVLFLGLFAMALAPSASAQDDEPSFQSLQEGVNSLGAMEISVGSKAVSVSWQGIEIGANLSAWIREKVSDLDGEGDPANVSEQEAEDARVLLTHYVQQEFDIYAHDDRFNDYLLIDQSSPSGAEVTSLVASGLEGPVAQEQGISLSFAAAVGFATRSADVHTVKLDMGRYYFRAVDEEKAADLVGDFSITVKGSDGWSIDPSSIQPECVADNFVDGAMVFTAEDVNCFTGRSGVLVGFSITGGEDGAMLPGFEALGLLVALVGAGVLARRRF